MRRSSSIIITAAAIQKFGSEEQKAEWLPRMATGEAIGCFGLTEPDHGSDPGSMRTFARQDGSDWVLSGTKMWITNGSIADIAVVWANSAEGIRGFLVPCGTPGFSARDIHKKLSLRASITSELYLDDVRLPAEAVLPGVAGLKGPLSCLTEARYGIAWGVTGAARTCLESAVGYARTREQFGKPIGQNQVVQHRLAEMLMSLEQGRSMAMLATMSVEEPDAAERSRSMSMAKVGYGQAARFVSQQSIQLHGGIGMTEEYAVGHYFRRCMVIEHTFGDTAYHLARLAAEVE